MTEDEINEIVAKEHSREEILEAFRKISHFASINRDLSFDDERFKGIFDRLTEFVDDFDSSEVKFSLLCLNAWNIKRQYHCLRNHEFLLKLDKRNVKLYKGENWPFNETFQYVDLWCKLKCATFSDMCHFASYKMGVKPKRFTAEQLIRFCFFLNLSRRSNVNMYEVEYYIERNLNQYSMNEICCALLGFFKTEVPIRSIDLLQKIMEKSIVECDSMEDIALSAVMKSLRCLG